MSPLTSFSLHNAFHQLVVRHRRSHHQFVRDEPWEPDSRAIIKSVTELYLIYVSVEATRGGVSTLISHSVVVKLV